MGLDITAYRKLSVDPAAKIDEDGDTVNWKKCWKPGISLEWSERCWPGRAAGIGADNVYAYEERMDFRAGSYSGYNDWRSELAKMVGKTTKEIWDTHAPGPFVELIDFADNEGVIGPAVAAKLAKDFAEHQTQADAIGGWFAVMYRTWRKAFEVAADGGAVDFH